jgi:hypothetical protein
MNKCPSCGGFMLKDETLCARCERLTAIGTIVGALLRLADGALCDDALEALGFLLRERSKLQQAGIRALIEEQRSAQRDAHGAYADGLAEGRRSERGGW